MDNSTGQKLKNLRIEKALSMDELVNTLNYLYDLTMTKSMMSRWENDLSEPSNRFLSAYARFFDIDLNYLVGLTDIKKKLSQVIKEGNKSKTFSDDGYLTFVLTPKELIEYNKIMIINQQLFIHNIYNHSSVETFKKSVIEILLLKRAEKSPSRSFVSVNPLLVVVVLAAPVILGI